MRQFVLNTLHLELQPAKSTQSLEIAEVSKGDWMGWRFREIILIMGIG
jgi:hypothetical protein